MNASRASRGRSASGIFTSRSRCGTPHASDRATSRSRPAAAVVSLVAKVFWLPGAAVGFVLSEFYPDLPYHLLPFGPIVGPMVTGAIIGTLIPIRFLIQTYKRAVTVEAERRHGKLNPVGSSGQAAGAD